MGNELIAVCLVLSCHVLIGIESICFIMATQNNSAEVSEQLNKLTVEETKSDDEKDASTGSSALTKNQKKKAKEKAKKAAAAATTPNNSANLSNTSESATPQTSGAENPAPTEGESDSDSDEEKTTENANNPTNNGEKKKKKKKKKKTGANTGSVATGADEKAWSSACMILRLNTGPSNYNGNNIRPSRVQTSPPSIPVAAIYPGKIYPQGEIMPHGGDWNSFRAGSDEKKAQEKINTELYNEIREAAEVHRQVRGDFMRWIKPGLNMIEIAQRIENATKALIGADGLKRQLHNHRIIIKWAAEFTSIAQAINFLTIIAMGMLCIELFLCRGWAFPTGLSLNHVAAHYTPNYKDKTILQQSDLMKVDFGIHVSISRTAF
jgi:methionyl aminopeptidase